MPVVALTQPPSFTPPAFDIARQTSEQWGAAADEAWKAYRAMAAHGFREQRQNLLDNDVITARKSTPKGGAGNLTPPASHTASEAAQANKDSPSMRVGLIRCVAAALACGPPLKNGYPLDSGARFGQDEIAGGRTI